MKTCFKCKRSLPRDAFYKHSAMSDGLLGKCKECTKADVSANYGAKRDKYVAYEKAPQRVASRHRRAPVYQKRQRAKYPAKYKARMAVANALRDGRLAKKACEVCGSERSEAHHEDYSKPLDVKWLCRPHHREADKRMKAA